MYLKDIAHARSGDKANHANIAVIAYRQAGFSWLKKHLIAEKVADYFALGPAAPLIESLRAKGMQEADTLEASYRQGLFGSFVANRVERFEVRNLLAFNFVLYDVLAGGASRSLRIDTQGKALGLALLQMELPIDDPVMVRELMARPTRTSES